MSSCRGLCWTQEEVLVTIRNEDINGVGSVGGVVVVDLAARRETMTQGMSMREANKTQEMPFFEREEEYETSRRGLKKHASL
jgi:hypothetical protein